MKNAASRFHIPVSAVLSPLAGIVVCIVLILACGERPTAALLSLFTGTFTNVYYFGSMLNTAAFLLTAGAGAAIAIQSGNMNLGGEGQIYAGGFVAALLLAPGSTLPAPLAFVCALLASVCTGALMALVSALLYELRGAAVLLTSFLVSAASLPLIDGLIIASKSSAEGQNLLALPYIKEAFRFPQLLAPSPFTATFFIAVAICIAAWIYLRFTKSGQRLQIWGKAPEFALYCGYSSALNSIASLAVSGALHAITGFFAVTGTYYTCHKDFYVGMGWNALSCALIVASQPLALIPSALVLSWLYTSASRVGLTQGFAFDISGIVQGVVLFAIAIPFSAKAAAGRRRKAQIPATRTAGV